MTDGEKMGEGGEMLEIVATEVVASQKHCLFLNIFDWHVPRAVKTCS